MPFLQVGGARKAPFTENGFYWRRGVDEDPLPPVYLSYEPDFLMLEGGIIGGSQYGVDPGSEGFS